MAKMFWLVAIALIGALAFIGSAFAHSSNNLNGMHNNLGGMRQHHEEMKDVMEEGSYAGLEGLRARLGFNIMPWVDNDETFEEAKRMHEAMHSNNGYGMNGMRYSLKGTKGHGIYGKAMGHNSCHS